MLLKILNTNKASIINEFFVNANDMTLIIILRLFNVIFKSGIVPDDWCMGYITPMFKSGDPGNYRGITLLTL